MIRMRSPLALARFAISSLESKYGGRMRGVHLNNSSSPPKKKTELEREGESEKLFCVSSFLLDRAWPSRRERGTEVKRERERERERER